MQRSERGRCRRDALMLIGDPEYYGRFFGFTAERTGGWRLPGPFEPRRLLALGSEVPGGSGAIEPRADPRNTNPRQAGWLGGGVARPEQFERPTLKFVV